MPFLSRVLLSLCLVSGAFGTAQAQGIPRYDPAFIPFDLEPVRLKECGITIGMDPRWTARKEQSKKEKGVETKYTFSLTDAYWDTHIQPVEKVVVNPAALLTVTCKTAQPQTNKNFDGLAFVANSIHKSMSGKSGTSIAPLREMTLSGKTRAFQIVGAERKPKKSLADFSMIYAIHNGIDISIFVRVYRDPPKRVRKQVAAGETVVVDDITYGTVKFVTESPVRQEGFTQVVHPIRTAQQNARLIERFRLSIRAD